MRALAGAIVAAVAATAPTPTPIPIIAARSQATFSVSHVYVTRVSGSVPIVRGMATFAGDGAIPTALEAVLDPRRIDTQNGDRDEDLQSGDWFDTAHFPTWTFTSTAVRATASGFDVDGTLNVRGVAQALTLHVIVVSGRPHPHYRATGTIDRRKFGMRVTPMDALIGGTVDLAIDAEFGAAAK